MNTNLYTSLSWSDGRAKYYGLPLEQIDKTLNVLDQKYQLNMQKWSKLKNNIASSQVLDTERNTVDRALTNAELTMKNINQTGNYHLADMDVENAAQEFMADKNIKVAFGKRDSYTAFVENGKKLVEKHKSGEHGGLSQQDVDMGVALWRAKNQEWTRYENGQVQNDVQSVPLTEYYDIPKAILEAIKPLEASDARDFEKFQNSVRTRMSEIQRNPQLLYYMTEQSGVSNKRIRDLVDGILSRPEAQGYMKQQVEFDLIRAYGDYNPDKKVYNVSNGMVNYRDLSDKDFLPSEINADGIVKRVPKTDTYGRYLDENNNVTETPSQYVIAGSMEVDWENVGTSAVQAQLLRYKRDEMFNNITNGSQKFGSAYSYINTKVNAMQDEVAVARRIRGEINREENVQMEGVATKTGGMRTTDITESFKDNGVLNLSQWQDLAKQAGFANATMAQAPAIYAWALKNKDAGTNEGAVATKILDNLRTTSHIKDQQMNVTNDLLEWKANTATNNPADKKSYEDAKYVFNKVNPDAPLNLYDNNGRVTVEGQQWLSLKGVKCGKDGVYDSGAIQKVLGLSNGEVVQYKAAIKWRNKEIANPANRIAFGGDEYDDNVGTFDIRNYAQNVNRKAYDKAVITKLNDIVNAGYAGTILSGGTKDMQNNTTATPQSVIQRFVDEYKLDQNVTATMMAKINMAKAEGKSIDIEIPGPNGTITMKSLDNTIVSSKGLFEGVAIGVKAQGGKGKTINLGYTAGTGADVNIRHDEYKQLEQPEFRAKAYVQNSTSGSKKHKSSEVVYNGPSGIVPIYQVNKNARTNANTRGDYYVVHQDVANRKMTSREQKEHTITLDGRRVIALPVTEASTAYMNQLTSEMLKEQ